MVETFTVGDSFEWKIDFRHGYHPHKLPSKVSVKAFIKNADSDPVELTNAAIESKHISAFLSSKDSLKLKPGRASLILRFANEDGFRKTLIADTFEIMPAIEDETFDPRTEAQRCLDQARSALSKFIASGGRVKRYTIGSRTIEYSTITELQKVIDYYLEQVYLEECRRAGRDPRKILVKFV